MRRAAYAFVITTGILAVMTVAAHPVLYIALLTIRPIGFLLIATPMLFLISGTFLLSHIALRKYGRVVWILTPILVLAAVGIGLPLMWNQPTSQAIKTWVEADQPPENLRISGGIVALLTPDTAPSFMPRPN